MSAELQAHMTDAVKALGQQIGESMKSMQDQINQFASSRMPQAAMGRPVGCPKARAPKRGRWRTTRGRPTRGEWQPK